MPQIEVTFDIDANGIVNVSAKDMGTGAEQKITITASSNLSKEDIDKAVREAEQYAAEDKARKEEVDTRNAGDQMVYQTENTLKEMGDKLDAADKSEIESKLSALKTALQGSDTAAIKSATEALTQATAFSSAAFTWMVAENSLVKSQHLRLSPWASRYSTRTSHTPSQRRASSLTA